MKIEKQTRRYNKDTLKEYMYDLKYIGRATFHSKKGESKSTSIGKKIKHFTNYDKFVIAKQNMNSTKPTSNFT